ncbi:hypothetical protein HX837_01160 [Marine Group I thaumarchaeote]|uniref:Uncharacterized protein n=1 Tax=Marine Group I thaumarchaeote TaxID=2511932 RepID=A0A7K4MPH4_9ARCH|nr:hypothetical protein [Marine Group I thaumarchaeote]
MKNRLIIDNYSNFCEIFSFKIYLV